MTEAFDFMQVSVDEAVELSAVANGWEGELQIINVKPNAEKSTIQVRMALVGEEFTKSINHPLFYPKEGDDKEQQNNSLLNIRRFFEAFDINGDDRRDPASWQGLSALAILKLTSTDNWGDQNKVSKWLAR